MGAKIMIQTDTICLIEDRLHLRSGPHRRARDDRIVNSILPSSLFMCDPSRCSVYAQTLLLFGKVVCASTVMSPTLDRSPLCTTDALEFF
jgi:hypothetical protein